MALKRENTQVYPRSSVPWGERFGRLEPQPGTDTFGRVNFNIHGGIVKGSAGCIDIGNNAIDFFDELRQDFYNEEQAIVEVDYSGVLTKSCNCKNISLLPANWIK